MRTLLVLICLLGIAGQAQRTQAQPTSLTLRSRVLTQPLKFDGLFYETANGRVALPSRFYANVNRRSWSAGTKMADARVVTVNVTAQQNNFLIEFRAVPSAGIIKWGFAVDARKDEYFTGLMERVVDGPQAASWAPGIQAAMDLRGQQVEMIVKPTTSIYAPFYLSSRGYGVFVKGTWPGRFDFAASDPDRVKIEFEGPSL